MMYQFLWNLTEVLWILTSLLILATDWLRGEIYEANKPGNR